MNALGARLRSPLARLLVVILLALGVSASSHAFVAVSVAIAPPPLPVYAQPVCPGLGYIWTPGYWAWGPDGGYYWVPGTWVLAPYAGALWTPGYWGWANGFYVWHGGYWGPRVGYYGGINYGFGYTGIGFYGGYWSGGVYRYNTAVTNVNVNVVRNNTYNRTVVENTTNVNRVSYNGPGGITRQPTNEERVVQADRHRAPTSAQTQHERAASADRSQWASANNGNPSTMATARPAYKERGAGGQHAGGPRYQQGNAAQGGPQGRPQNTNPEMRAQGGPHQGQGGQGQPRGERGQKQGQGGGERGQHQGQGGGERKEGGGPPR